MATTKGNDAAVLRALSNPKRLALLKTLLASPNAESSPARLAPEIGEPLGQVSYHVHQLADAGLIEYTHMEPVRGAVEHFYRAAPGADRVFDAVAELTEAITKLGR